jgi:septal ring factor EnvC (AmiA/AmiB activator)
MISITSLIAIAGPIAGVLLSVILYFSRKTLEDVSSTLKNVETSLVELRVEVPKSYVTKEELLTHMKAEENWHSHITTQLRDIRDEMSALRDWSHHR